MKESKNHVEILARCIWFTENDLEMFIEMPGGVHGWVRFDEILSSIDRVKNAKLDCVLVTISKHALNRIKSSR
jgi:hypothetical protein